MRHPSIVRVSATAALLASLALAGTVIAQSPGRENLRKTQASLVALLSSANVLDLNHAREATVPGPTAGLVPLRTLRGALQFVSPRYFADKDAWGQDILYWSDGYDYMLLSLGADGEPEFDYGADPPYRDVPRGRLTSEPEQDIVIVSGSIYHGPGFRSFGRATVSAMQSLSVAVQTYSIDNNDYPLPTDGAVTAALLKPYLEPTYIRAAPTEDEWGHPLLYWSDRTSYAVISTGADGIADAPYELWGASDFDAFEGRRTEEPASDIVLIDAAFVQWPRSTTPP